MLCGATPMRKTLTPQRTLIVVLLVVALSPQLAACAERAPYPVKDSGIYAEEADLVWLDNQRVLFHGHKGMEPSSDPNKILRLVDRGLYRWDTTTGALELYDTFDKRSDGLLVKSSLCVHDGVLTHVNRGMVITGKRGQETKTPFPKPAHWFNPHSCRYYDTKPFWVVEGHRTIPLLEEHGYLDLGSVSPPQPDPLTLRFENPNPAISFYSVAAKKSVTLPIGWQEVGFLQVHYAPFRDAYLLSGFQYYDEQRGFLPAWPRDTPHRVWWLSPDGTVKKEELPNVSPVQGGWPGMLPIRNGLLVLAGYSKNMSDPGTSGGFVVRDQNVQKVLIGGLRRAAVSADGCRVAVVNDTYEKKPVAERLRLQIIQLCQGE
jgi:hypothetical protein